VFAALDQRIAVRYHIGPMDLGDSTAHRLSGGIPRALNNAAVAALIAAASDGKEIVDDACARKAVTEITRE
jgi:hypothetical protein